MNWDNHQLVRLRLFVATMGELLGGLRASVGALEAGSKQDYRRFFGPGQFGAESYRFTGRGKNLIDPTTGCPATQSGVAQALFDGLLGLAQDLAHAEAAAGPSGLSMLARNAPRPLPELKVRPRV